MLGLCLPGLGTCPTVKELPAAAAWGAAGAARAASASDNTETAEYNILRNTSVTEMEGEASAWIEVELETVKRM